MVFLPIFNRVKSETDLEKLNQLADFLEVTPQYVSAMKKRNEFPADWAFKIAQKYNLSTDWLLTGKGPKKLNNITNNFQYRFPILNEVDAWLHEEMNGTVNEKNSWLSMEFQRHVPEFKEWKKRREEQEKEDSSFSDRNIA